MKKINNYYGTYMQVLQEMSKKTSGYYGNICGYNKECYKNPVNTMDQYAGIAMNEEC